MVDILAYQLAAFFGSVAAIIFATIAPYFKKWQETKEVTGIDLKFDRKFAFSAGVAFLFALLAGILNFETTEANINTNDTIFKVFVSAFLTGVGVNFGLNQFMKPSTSLVTALKEEREQNSSKS